MGRTTRVLVVHRHRIFAEALARPFESEPGLVPVGTASTRAAARIAVDVLGPDVTVVDMGLDRGSGLMLTSCLAQRDPPVRVVALLVSDDRTAATRAIRAGADAVTTKDSPAADLVSAVLALARNECWVPPHLLGDVLQEVRSSVPAPNDYDRKLARLTPREREVLERMVAGRDRASIARELGVTVNTVRTHAQNLHGKLGVHSSLEAVTVARRARRGNVGGGPS